jgi:hypothetical protein
VKLLRDFPRTIINYGDEHIYTNMIKETRHDMQRASYRHLNYLLVTLGYYFVCDVEFDMSDIFLA